MKRFGSSTISKLSSWDRNVSNNPCYWLLLPQHTAFAQFVMEYVVSRRFGQRTPATCLECGSTTASILQEKQVCSDISWSLETHKINCIDQSGTRHELFVRKVLDLTILCQVVFFSTTKKEVSAVHHVCTEHRTMEYRSLNSDWLNNSLRYGELLSQQSPITDQSLYEIDISSTQSDASKEKNKLRSPSQLW